MDATHPVMCLPSRTPMTRTTTLPAQWLIFVVLSTCSAAKADETVDIRRLYDAGHTVAAMTRLDRSLAAFPNDPQLRFLKGVMLADGMRKGEALVLFEKLTEDFPELAEPFNNLAVLYAATGDYQKARQALEQSLRSNPGYATAHENLGDVLATLARQSYGRALQLAPKSATLPRKLALISELSAPIDKNGDAIRGSSDSTVGPVVTPMSK